MWTKKHLPIKKKIRSIVYNIIKVEMHFLSQYFYHQLFTLISENNFLF